MRVRRQTLEEWFLDLQLRSVRDDHFHLPFTVDVPVTDLHAAWMRATGRFPAAAVTVRATAELVRRVPNLNRVLFRTPIGARIVELDGVHVNVPVLVRHGERAFLSATVVRDADQRTVEAIGEALRAARERPVDELPINRLFLDGRDTFVRRLRLRVLHQLAYRWPWAWVRGGAGAVGVTSLHHRRVPTPVRGVALGPNALTVLVLGLHGDAPALHLGLGFDHALLTGDEIGLACHELTRIFDDPASAGLLPQG